MSAGLVHSPLPSGRPEAGAPRLLCQGRWPGVEFFVREQDISHPTTWSIRDARHAVVVHLDGPIHSLETELAGVGAAMDPPMPGEVWLVPARERYASRAQGKLVRYAEFFIDAGALAGPAEPRSLRPRAGHYDGFLHRSAMHLQHLSQAGDDLAGMMAQAMSQTVLLHIFREYAADGAGLRKHKAVKRLDSGSERIIEKHVQAHLGEAITLETLAAAVHLGVHELLLRFRGSFGTTPAQYVIEQRLRRARWLLTATPLDITRIALDTGFSSHGHLTTVFRSRLGVTPSQYRAGQRRLSGPYERMRVNR